MKTGLVLVGHGSRAPESLGVYEEIADLVEGSSDYVVKVGYMKHGRPNIIEALRQLIEEGVKRIVVVPLFILPGLHVQEDIPVLLGLKDGEAPDFGYGRIRVPDDVDILYASHIGADERLAEVVLDRAREVLE